MVASRLMEKTRQRLDREIGAVRKAHEGRLRFALAFPNTYRVGMSNLGYHIVYRMLNDREDSVCERLFLPDPSDLEGLTSPLFTMESQTPVRDFDVLAFSVSYELDYPNILRILSLSRIAELAAERSPDEPLVIAGGPAATFNPEVLAPFVDLFVIGEAEAVLPGLVDALAGHQGNRTELLEALAQVPGVYVPRFYEPEYDANGLVSGMQVSHGAPKRIRRQWTQNLDAWNASSAILTSETEFSNMVLAEVARGCGRQCRFCVAGYAFLPPRARQVASVLEDIAGAETLAHPSEREHPRVGLVSASVFDHPSSLLICQSLVEKDRLFSISSTRADTLNEDVAQALHRGGHETLTIAPEAGTDRLRMVINKAMTHRDVMSAATIAWEAGFRRLKLYFMAGLPTETEEDVDGITSTVKEIAGMFAWERLIVSLGCFVPKPWTPFQWAPMEEEKLLADKLRFLRGELRPLKKVQVAGESAREAVVQGVLARGDRRLRDSLLILTSENVSWRAAFRRGGVDPSFYAQRSRRRAEIFPWDHLDLGVKKEYLWAEYQRAMEAALTPACPNEMCGRCGVCSTQQLPHDKNA